MGTLKKRPRLVVSDGQGQVFDIPELEAVAMSGDQVVVAKSEEYIRLPQGSTLFELPQRHPLAYDPARKKIITLTEYGNQPVYAVAAFLAPAYTQMYRTAYVAQAGAGRLPLFAYTAVGWASSGFYVPAIRVDSDERQDPIHFDETAIKRRSSNLLKKYPGNRLVSHLVENCVRRYHCPAAQNWAMGRWEAPIPTSTVCNAHCVGCISKQSDSGISATQDRLTFVPTVAEIIEYTVPHLQKAPRAVVSFGQGCEGEPLLQGDLLIEAVTAIRRRTDRGIINLNTNASRPEIVERLFQAGLDSIRVSMNSAQVDLYSKYFSPRHYGMADVLKSISLAAQYGKWISLNYFIFPGLTDHPDESSALIELVKRHHINYIQMRNLNIDPEWYVEALGLHGTAGRAVGIRNWMAKVRQAAPWIGFGYFNPPREVMSAFGHTAAAGRQQLA
jgi:pyruvate-formate lyase-activating enzyme